MMLKIIAGKFPLLLFYTLIPLAIQQDIRSLRISTIPNGQFSCINTTCLPYSTIIVSKILYCQTNCLANIQCQAAHFHRITHQCQMFSYFTWSSASMVPDMNSITLVVSDDTRVPSIWIPNWIYNGDGETGPCATNYDLVHPTGWNYDGPITQVQYGVSNANQNMMTPGPSDRGKCHFYGFNSTSATTMWQIVDMTTLIDPARINNQIVRFNLSAWLGGYARDEDATGISLTFLTQANQTVGNTTTLGPVSPAGRNNVTSLVYRQSSGQVPIGARLFKLLVTVTRAAGSTNDGDVDNIALRFYC
ncbi:unnamed protein product [Adineta ricciae]|uniref:Apple domain-containing protein n=1 Tax=Adineta ricciae TaxID=249248 RepID=A0A815H6W8_ADIRI|nr:unnamed protein product [Adineta ricciae]CAF1347550.1 unnamed protein product [Adineta ricciae]